MLLYFDLFKRELLQLYREKHGLVLPISNNPKNKILSGYFELSSLIQEAETNMDKRIKCVKKNNDKLVLKAIMSFNDNGDHSDIPF